MKGNKIIKEALFIEIIDSIPIKDDFIILYNAATAEWRGNGLYTDEQLYSAICNSWYAVSIYHDRRLIGFGRIISDGIYQTLICDVMVHPEYQNQGIGTEIMNALLNKCEKEGVKWIQLLSAKGKQGFYEKFGFATREDEAPGMTLFL